MKTSELNFELPEELIAKHPANPRDAAKLLILHPKNQTISESTFKNIGDFLGAGDVLVFNETKVFPARVYGVKPTGGKLEIVFLSEVEPKLWEVMIGGRVANGTKVSLSKNLSGTIEKNENGNFLKVNLGRSAVFNELEEVGQVPLPPYIKREVSKEDESEYQAVFAKNIGSAAAPTASLHFTKNLITNLKSRGVQIEYVTLHVGLGTFAPVKTEKLEDHPIHSEYFEVQSGTAARLNQAKKEGRRIIAVGTTVMRTLESAAQSGVVVAQKTETKLFIYPGYKFKLVCGLVTNFHTPKSSLLALVYAFAGQEFIQKAYQYAIEKKYRFYSYGDGMLILPD